LAQGPQVVARRRSSPSEAIQKCKAPRRVASHMGQAGIKGDAAVQCWILAGRPRRRVLTDMTCRRHKGQCAPDLDMSRMRQVYLNRLGISRDGRSLAGPSKTPDPPSDETACVEMAVVAAAPTPLKEAESAVSCVDSTARPAEVAHPKRLDDMDGFRLAFLRKLSYRQVWVPHVRRSPPHQTVIIFDWDDTLICSSYLTALSDCAPTPDLGQLLGCIETVSANLLSQALQLGHTFIVTNAVTGWVECSAARFFPRLLPVLERVRVISARTNHEAQYPFSVAQWKTQAFLELQRQMNSQIIANLVSLGDADFEMDAAHAMSQAFARSFVKTIRFMQQPSPEELLKQLELVLQKLEKIVLSARNLKINLARKWSAGEGAGSACT